MKIPSPVLKALLKKLAPAGADKILFGPDFLEASDQYLTIEARDEKFKGEWQPFSVNAKQLSSVVSKLSGEITLERNGNLLLIASVKAKYELPLSPQTPNTTTLPEKGYPIPFKPFLEVIDYAILAAERTEKFDYTSCVQVVAENGILRAAASNGKRLAFAEVALEKAAGPYTMIIPSAAVPALRMLSGDVQVYPTDKVLYFVDETTTIAAKKLAKEFPNYIKIVPTHFSFETKLNAQTMCEVLDNASPIAAEANALGVGLDFDSTKLVVSSQCDRNNGKIGSFSEQVAHEQIKPDPYFDEDDFMSSYGFTLNHKWLLDFFGSSTGDTYFRGIDSRSPVLLESGGRKMLISPIGRR